MTLPNFLVIGAYKCGTTSLGWYLQQHPDVFVPDYPEPRFFAFDAHGDPDGERAHNPMFHGAVKTLERYESLFSGVADERAVGEVSPEYLKNPAAAGRIAARIPDAKLIAILRDPVERAYSDYLMYRRDGREPEADFMTALRLQESRRHRSLPTGQYLITGNYGDQLARYRDHFGSDQIKVVLHEDLAADRNSVMAEIFAFLDVDPVIELGSQPRLNPSGAFSSTTAQRLYALRRSTAPLTRRIVPNRLKRRIDNRLLSGVRRPPIEPEPARWLRRYYAEQISMVAELTGIDVVRHWSSPATDGTAAR